jgi:hypothetical protein
MAISGGMALTYAGITEATAGDKSLAYPRNDNTDPIDVCHPFEATNHCLNDLGDAISLTLFY